jgi:Flp pilus assembly protein TadG
VIQRVRDDAGFATLETTLMVAVLVPLLFGIIEFGWLFQRWLAAESVAIHAARYAGELGGDEPALRTFVSRELASVNIDPTRARVEVVPARVDWREPVRVTVRTTERIDLPFLFTTSVDLAASAIARGEVDR